MRLVELKLLPLLLDGAAPVRLVFPPRRAKEVAVYLLQRGPQRYLSSVGLLSQKRCLAVQRENLGFAPANKSATDLLVPVELAASYTFKAKGRRNLGLLCE
jgi:hypothetical protein